MVEITGKAFNKLGEYLKKHHVKVSERTLLPSLNGGIYASAAVEKKIKPTGVIRLVYVVTKINPAGEATTKAKVIYPV